MMRLELENGMTFEGVGFGTEAPISGEVVFNTGMVGYPESMTDPSYRGQLLVLTHPLVGNYGVPDDKKDSLGMLSNFESERIQVQGLVVSYYSREYSHWNAVRSLGDWMKSQGVPGVFDVDTRQITKVLREKGTMLGKIVGKKDCMIDDPNARNLVAEVSCKEVVVYKRGKRRVVLVDCGVKNTIVRSLIERDVSVIRVPWDYDFSGIDYDGVLVSNGPGDPKMATKTIEHIRRAMSGKAGMDGGAGSSRKIKPIFGICLGNQILALAAGADTYKLRYGHRSQNQPCVLEGTKRCFITSQNHGFAVKTDTLPSSWKPWFVNANDGTNEGIRHTSLPFFTVQFHPEATPGPVDTGFLFDEFVEACK